MEQKKLKKVVKWENLNIDKEEYNILCITIMALWVSLGFGLIYKFENLIIYLVLNGITAIICAMMLLIPIIPLKRTVWYEEIK